MGERGGSEVEQLQEAFFNFDPQAKFTLTLDDLRFIVTTDGEPMDDVRFTCSNSAVNCCLG